MRILVGHESRQGTTAEIAERIAETFRRISDEVDVVPMANAKSVEGYEGVFLYRQSGNLANKPVWLFSVGMSAGLPAPLRGPARRAQEKRIAQTVPVEVRPRSHRVFSGVGSPDLLPPVGAIPVPGSRGPFRRLPGLGRHRAVGPVHRSGPPRVGINATALGPTVPGHHVICLSVSPRHIGPPRRIRERRWARRNAHASARWSAGTQPELVGSSDSGSCPDCQPSDRGGFPVPRNRYRGDEVRRKRVLIHELLCPVALEAVRQGVDSDAHGFLSGMKKAPAKAGL
jgi:menaquinone-dependent protoporphyrinogen oxidase